VRGSNLTEADEMLVGYFDELTTSVWVQVTPPGTSSTGVGPSTQTRTARVLWDAGFFGKGSLSRSEPTWRTRKINEEKIKKQRERGMKGR
jgi:tRNA-splicing endonuclease subunit Sen2